jgi:hypothetical protein
VNREGGGQQVGTGFNSPKRHKAIEHLLGDRLIRWAVAMRAALQLLYRRVGSGRRRRDLCRSLQQSPIPAPKAAHVLPGWFIQIRTFYYLAFCFFVTILEA